MHNNILFYNKLRVLAIINVIIIHVSCSLFFIYKIGTYKWWISSFFDIFSHFAVPLFLMISGALLLPKEESIKTFYTKRTQRILIPFLFWLIFYYIQDITTGTISSNYFHSFIEGIGSGTKYHLWYIYMLVGIYLFIPFIRICIKNLSQKGIKYFIIFWIILLFLRYKTETRKLIENMNIEFFYYVGYVITGYYFSSQKIFRKHNYTKISALLLIVISNILILTATYYFSKTNGKSSEIFFNCLSPLIVFMSIGWFLLYQYSSFSKISFLEKKICTYSYGIYLSHVFVLEQLKTVYWIKYLYYMYPAIGIPVLVILCLFLSLLLIMIIHKIPKIGKYISG